MYAAIALLIGATMLRTLVGTLVAPQVEKFVFQHALRTSPEELLRGATHAAETISTTLKSAVAHTTGDAEAMAALRASKFIDTSCQKALKRDLAAQREARMPNAYDANGAARLHNVRMIVGPDRETCDKAREPLQRVELGDCLVVVGGVDEFLYSQSTQERLLAEYGATVQAEVVFDEGFPVDAKHHASYLFETFIPGARLLNEEFDHDYSFTVVDVNGVAAGNEFWTRAAPHSQPFSIKDAARLFTE